MCDLCCFSSRYLLYLVGLQEVAGFSEVGFERLWLQLGLDGRAMLGVHLFFGGDLQAQTDVRQARTQRAERGLTSIKQRCWEGWIRATFINLLLIL